MTEVQKKIAPEMAVIDIIHEHRETEKIFKRLEQETGSCVCCQGLFLSLKDAAERFGFDLKCVLAELNAVAGKPDNQA